MDPARVTRRAPEWQVWTALLIVYIVWGSTYLAISVVDETMPPLLTAAVRHLSAGVIVWLLLVVRHGRGSFRISRNELGGAAFVGLCLLLGGNGLVVLGERDVPSGLAALIIAIVPLFVVMLRRIFGDRVAFGTYAGVGLGFAGVAVLIVPHGISGDVSLFGMLLLVAASLSWAAGTFSASRIRLPRDPLATAGIQMLAGGASLLVAGLLTGELGLVHVDRFSTASLVSLLYLIVFGSVIAYTAYTWLLQNTSVSRVATYAYVNPLVAILLGAAILNEKIDSVILIGAAMIVVSVVIVIRTEARANSRNKGTTAGLAQPPSAGDAEVSLPG